MRSWAQKRFVAFLALGGLLSFAAQVGAQPVEQVRVPADTVVQVSLDQPISSQTATIGQPVDATINADDRSGFPLGTRFEGSITNVRQATADRPGIVDMRWQDAVLPNGQVVPINGQLSSLASDSVQRTSEGRLISRGGHRNNLQSVWIGAAAGAVLGTLTNLGLIKGALLGGLGGFIYQTIRHHNRGSREALADVNVPAGMPFGIRLNRPAFFVAQAGYQYRPGVTSAVLGVRQTPYARARVFVDGRRIDLASAYPFSMNGVMYFPLAPIADAAGMDLTAVPGENNFTLTTPEGDVQGQVGRPDYLLAGERSELTHAPVWVNDQIFVPAEFLTDAAGMRVNWNPSTLRLDLETDQNQ